MRTALNLVWHVNPWIWIFLGTVFIGACMTGFAWVTWPEGFEGVIKTFVGLLTGLLDFP